jgi:hypothetical protein
MGLESSDIKKEKGTEELPLYSGKTRNDDAMLQRPTEVDRGERELSKAESCTTIVMPLMLTTRPLCHHHLSSSQRLCYADGAYAPIWGDYPINTAGHQ